MKKLLLFVVALLGSVTMSNAQVPGIKTLGIIGDATPGGWGADTDLTTTDNENYTLAAIELIGGKSVKFRANDAWANDLEWGGAGLSGTAVVKGANIPVAVSGTYTVSFNVVTLAYSIALPQGSNSVVLVKGSAAGAGSTVLTTTDGENYMGLLTLAAGDLWFDLDGTVQGGANFASGTVTSGDNATAIAVTAQGGYKVTYVKSTGAYTFVTATVDPVKIGIIGTVIGGFGDADEKFMTTTDGINYSISGVVMVAGGLKFRQDAAWTHNWGGGLELPLASGVAVYNGDNLNLAAADASTYDITFNRFTGAFTFVDTIRLSVAGFDGVAGDVTYSNPVSDVIVLSSASDVVLYTLSGELVAKQSNTTSVDVSGLAPATYIIKINGSQSGEKVVVE